MSSGTIKFFNESKGFGFVIEDGTNQEYFVHASGLVDQVDKDDKVTFSVVDGQKGKNAVDVKRVS